MSLSLTFPLFIEVTIKSPIICERTRQRQHTIFKIIHSLCTHKAFLSTLYSQHKSEAIAIISYLLLVPPDQILCEYNYNYCTEGRIYSLFPSSIIAPC